MQLEHDTTNGIVFVTIQEERLEYKNVNAFQSEVLSIIDEGHKKLAFDMGQVIFMDSRGLSAFLSILRAVGKEGRVALYNVQEKVNKIFKLTHTDRLFLQRTDRTEALRALEE